MSSYLPWFPEPGTYIRYWDTDAKVTKFAFLLDRRMPYKYPIRLDQLAAATKSTNGFTFRDLNPSDSKEHIYMAYLGVKPGFTYELWHPYNVKTLKWDERLQDIPEDSAAHIEYEDSPYEHPTKAIWISRDNYPNVRPKNMLGYTATPEIIWLAAKYVHTPHEKLAVGVISQLQSGMIPALRADFGGDI